MNNINPINLNSFINRYQKTNSGQCQSCSQKNTLLEKFNPKKNTLKGLEQLSISPEYKSLFNNKAITGFEDGSKQNIMSTLFQDKQDVSNATDLLTAVYEKYEINTTQTSQYLQNENGENRLISNKFNVNITVEKFHIQGSKEAIDKAQDYFSPEKTSERIVNFATGKFELWAQNGDNSEKAQNAKVEKFYKLVKGAIKQGFGEAKNLLGPLPENIGNKISDTFDLTMKKLDNWFTEKQNIINPETINLQPETFEI